MPPGARVPSHIRICGMGVRGGCYSVQVEPSSNPTRALAPAPPKQHSLGCLARARVVASPRHRSHRLAYRLRGYCPLRAQPAPERAGGGTRK